MTKQNINTTSSNGSSYTFQKVNLDTREIWLVPDNENLEIDAASAAEFIANFRLLAYSSHPTSIEKPILIHMYCNGGSVDDGLAIYDNLKLYNKPFHIIAHNGALSMGGIILQSAAPNGLRILSPHSFFMLHAGSWSLPESNPATVITTMEQFKNSNDVCDLIYVESCKKYGKFFQDEKWTNKKIQNFWNKKMEKQQDVYLKPEEAIEYGLCDTILTTDILYRDSNLNKNNTTRKAAGFHAHNR